MNHKKTKKNTYFTILAIISSYIICILSYFLLKLIIGNGKQIDYGIISDFFASGGNYYSNPYYFYLPSFQMFSVFYLEYQIIKSTYIIMLGVILILLKYIELELIEKIIIYIFIISTFYLDVERGNSNFFILLIVEIILIIIQKYNINHNILENLVNSLLISFLIASALYKINFLIIVVLLLFYFYFDNGFRYTFRLVLLIVFWLLLLNFFWILYPSQIIYFLENISNKNIGITINFIIEQNQLSWLLLGISWVIFHNTKIIKNSNKHKVFLGIIFLIFILKIVGILIHIFYYDGMW